MHCIECIAVEKQLVADVASGVAGIREVDNRLKVQSRNQRLDSE
jgi:hypothetical protein